MNPANVDPALLVPGAVIDMTPAWVPEGICACGCGRETSTIQYADASKGLVRGAWRTFCKGHHNRVGRPHFEVTDAGCWEWLRACGGSRGNTYARWNGQFAHRWFYEVMVGPIPEGLCIDHVCENKRCVNPEHLEPVTNRENLRRWREGRS